LLGDQIVAVVATLAYSVAIVWLLHKFMPGGIRVEEEAIGLDVTEHAEVAYAFAER
jgi:ammonia channel protein AmtB